MYGKVFVINNFCLSKVWHRLNICGMNETYVKKLNNMLYNFLWGKDRGNIKREVVARPKVMGGLGLFDLMTKIQTEYIIDLSRIMEFAGKTEVKTEMSFPLYWLTKRGNSVLGATLRDVATLRDIPFYYYDMLKVWKKISNNHCGSPLF